MKLSARGVLAVLFVLAVAAVCVRLGFWQLDRLEQRRVRNAVVLRAMELPPLVLDRATLAAVARDPERYAFRRAVAQGTYDPGRDVVLRGRAREGRPGVHLVTPLRVAGSDTAVLVNRGWVHSPDAATLSPRPRPGPGPRVVEGILQAVPATPDRGAPVAGGEGGDTTWRRLDLSAQRARLPYPVLPLYLQQLPGPSDGEPPHPVPAPDLGEGSHLSYAFQWFAFAAIALLGLAVTLLRPARRTS